MLRELIDLWGAGSGSTPTPGASGAHGQTIERSGYDTLDLTSGGCSRPRGSTEPIAEQVDIAVGIGLEESDIPKQYPCSARRLASRRGL
jgi:hypothetical protein